ncbi:MAG: hypothetical protein WC833_04670 [Bacteroidales bacterium]|jgi:hypothetical protein
MATFNYRIDTQPLANELGNVSNNVSLTTGAMVSMQEAVIAAEERASDYVCDNVNTGFYALIRAQISQKLAKYKSDVDSQTMLLSQQKRALQSIKGRMERDYNMISRRYTKLFDGLNSNLRTRVFELDKPSVDFACKEIGRISNRTKYLTATIPVTHLESIAVSQKIIASNLKQRGFKVIDSMTSFIHEVNMQKKLTDKILVDDYPQRLGDAYIPVILYQFNRDRSGKENMEIVMTDTELNDTAKSTISEGFYSGLANIEWRQEDHSDEIIYDEFCKQLSESGKTPREKEVALKLFKANKYLTAKV